MRPEIQPNPDDAWLQISPLLDELVAQLPADDRTAILLRFYQKRTFAEVGMALGISEEAARKRLTRAVDKLRNLMTRRGVQVSAALIAVLLFEQTTKAAPAGVIAAAGAASTVATGHACTLATGAMKTMFIAKAKLVAIVVGFIFIMGATGVWFGTRLNRPQATTPVANGGGPASPALDGVMSLSPETARASATAPLAGTQSSPIGSQATRGLIWNVAKERNSFDVEVPVVRSGSPGSVLVGKNVNAQTRYLHGTQTSTFDEVVQVGHIVNFPSGIDLSEVVWNDETGSTASAITHDPVGISAIILSVAPDESSFVMNARTYGQVNAKVDADTRFYRDGKPSTFYDVVKVGEIVTVWYHTLSADHLVVRVHTPSTLPPPRPLTQPQ